MKTIISNLQTYVMKLQMFETLIITICTIKDLKVFRWIIYIDIYDEEKITCVKWNIFTWNFELDNSLSKVLKRHLEWIPQYITLVLFTNICI
jgi:hypothetical protein